MSQHFSAKVCESSGLKVCGGLPPNGSAGAAHTSAGRGVRLAAKAVTLAVLNFGDWPSIL